MLTPPLALAELGYAIFPCERKRPLTPNGCKDATSDAEQIERWWQTWPTANIGLATDGLLVVDVDVDGAGNANPWLADQPEKLLDLAAAPMALTPRGGRHYLFRQPEGSHFGNTAGRLAPHVDTRASGGYIVVAPSIVNGQAYRWASEGDFDTRPDQLPLPPAWLLDQLAASGGPAVRAKPKGEALPANKIPDGQRNAALTSLAGTMRRVGMTRAEILAALQTANAGRCVPPLPDSEVETIAGSVTRYPPNEEATAEVEHRDTRSTGAASPVMVNLADVQPQPVRWLWPKRIPLGKLTLIAGEPGQGKSTLLTDIAARVTTGRPWPDAAENPAGGVVMASPAGVVMLSAEDDPADTIRPRLDAAQADVTRVSALEGIELKAEGKQRCFNLEQDLPSLELAIQSQPNCRLVVVDPVSSYLGKTDSHRNAEVRSLLAPLSDLAAQYGVAVVLITHFSKGQNTKAMNAPTGSIAFIAAARASWIVARDKEDPSRRLFLPIKNNLAKNPGGLAFRIVDSETQLDGEAVGRIEWESGRIDLTADEAIGDAADAGGKSACNDAVTWLQELLANGPLSAADIAEAAEGELISSRTLKRAKTQAGVVSRQVHGEGGNYWEWVLPGAALITKQAEGQAA